jgi:hypothetical protein
VDHRTCRAARFSHTQDLTHRAPASPCKRYIST